MSAYFALFVLVLANLLNMLDRTIVSILGQSIKASLKLDDADLGFLLGTAFAVFYSVVGIAMGRISDFVSRKKMMAFGLALWSVMTALGGCANSFATLSLARIGVGVGEAVANPCSHSLLADVFPPRNRSLALGTYLTGTFLGSTTAMIVGGLFVQTWPHFCSAIPFAGACALPGWKAALVAVGLPGLLVALLVLTLHEPARRAHSQPGGTLRMIFREVASALPPFTLFSIHRIAGAAGLVRNLVMIAIIAALSATLVKITGDVAQWVAFGLGAYSIGTWGQVQSHGDKPLYRLTYGDRTFVLCTAATASVACIIGVFSVWVAPLAMRTFKVSAAQIGLGLGLIYTVGAILGVVTGGWLTDHWKRRDPRAPLGMTAVTLVGLIPSIAFLLAAKTLGTFFVGYFFLSFFISLWSGGTSALVQDLVLPRMRGAAAASYSLVSIVIASGLGPYWTGKVSKMTGSLNAGMYSILLLAPLAFLLLWLASRRLQHETAAGRLQLAMEAGEPAPR